MWRFINWTTVGTALCAGIIAGLMLGASTCQAGTLGVHAWSKHGAPTYEVTHRGGPSEHREFNNANFGLYYVSADGWTVGAYKNSYYRNTVYAGYVIQGPSFRPIDGFTVQTDLALALATGYRRVKGVGELRPMAMPQILLSHAASGAGVRYSVAPGQRGIFQHISFEKKF